MSWTFYLYHQMDVKTVISLSGMFIFEHALVCPINSKVCTVQLLLLEINSSCFVTLNKLC